MCAPHADLVTLEEDRQELGEGVRGDRALAPSGWECGCQFCLPPDEVRRGVRHFLARPLREIASTPRSLTRRPNRPIGEMDRRQLAAPGPAHDGFRAHPKLIGDGVGSQRTVPSQRRPLPGGPPRMWHPAGPRIRRGRCMRQQPIDLVQRAT